MDIPIYKLFKNRLMHNLLKLLNESEPEKNLDQTQQND